MFASPLLASGVARLTSRSSFPRDSCMILDRTRRSYGRYRARVNLASTTAGEKLLMQGKKT